MHDTLTGTLAGQIVMEGFLRLSIPKWARRLVTRGLAIIPVVVITAIYGEKGTGDLLIFSQVILSLQLPFAIVPLLRFTTSRRHLGPLAFGFKTSLLLWGAAAVVVGLNAWLLQKFLSG